LFCFLSLRVFVFAHHLQSCGGSAALWRCPWIWNERQGWLSLELASLGLAKNHQGDIRSSNGIFIPVHVW
jgi:hypothetical protein